MFVSHNYLPWKLVHILSSLQKNLDSVVTIEKGAIGSAFERPSLARFERLSQSFCLDSAKIFELDGNERCGWVEKFQFWP